MIKLKEAVIVEGKYDKIRLSSIVDAVIIETNGYGIFRDKEKLALIRRLAETNGIIVLTDSDGAGFVIRGKLSSVIPPEQIKHAYIPDILGKEKRKDAPSKEGKLGVEGMETKILLDALKQAGITVSDETKDAGKEITKADFYEIGLTGCANSRKRRTALLKRLNLPEHLPTNSLLKVVNALYTKAEFYTIMTSPATGNMDFKQTPGNMES